MTVVVKEKNITMSKNKIWPVGLIGFLFILMAFFAVEYNSLQSKSVAVDTSWSQVENQMQRRADLIPNLVNTVKGFTNHEDNVIKAVTDARAKMGSAQTPVEKDAANTELNSALSRLMMVVENYPDLKSSQHYSELMSQLEGTENRITVARKNYNKSVQEYNLGVKTFPGNVFANIYGFTEKPLFTADESAKVVPKVEF